MDPSAGRAQSCLVEEELGGIRTQRSNAETLALDETETLSKSRDQERKKEQIKLRLGMRTKLSRFESYLAIFGKAFQDTTWNERLGVVKAILLRNRVEGLEKELVGVSRQIEELKSRGG